jgi:hypothetical protein
MTLNHGKLVKQLAREGDQPNDINFRFQQQGCFEKKNQEDNS